MSARPQKITFGEMRSSGVRGLLIYCRDYKCSHMIKIAPADADRWSDELRLSDAALSARFAGSAAQRSGVTTLRRKWAPSTDELVAQVRRADPAAPPAFLARLARVPVEPQRGRLSGMAQIALLLRRRSRAQAWSRSPTRPRRPRTAGFTSSWSTAPSSRPAARLTNSARASCAPSSQAGSGGTNPGPM